jgi:hypothetical protein
LRLLPPGRRFLELCLAAPLNDVLYEVGLDLSLPPSALAARGGEAPQQLVQALASTCGFMLQALIRHADAVPRPIQVLADAVWRAALHQQLPETTALALVGQLLLGCWLAPALATPQAYGVFPEPSPHDRTCSNLDAISRELARLPAALHAGHPNPNVTNPNVTNPNLAVLVEWLQAVLLLAAVTAAQEEDERGAVAGAATSAVASAATSAVASAPAAAPASVHASPSVGPPRMQALTSAPLPSPHASPSVGPPLGPAPAAALPRRLRSAEMSAEEAAKARRQQLAAEEATFFARQRQLAKEEACLEDAAVEGSVLSDRYDRYDRYDGLASSRAEEEEEAEAEAEDEVAAAAKVEEEASPRAPRQSHGGYQRAAAARRPILLTRRHSCAPSCGWRVSAG